MGKHDVIHKTGSTQNIALSSEDNRATVTGNMYDNFREIWTFRFSDTRANRQTYRDAHRNTSHPYWVRGEVKMAILVRFGSGSFPSLLATTTTLSTGVICVAAELVYAVFVDSYSTTTSVLLSDDRAETAAAETGAVGSSVGRWMRCPRPAD